MAGDRELRDQPIYFLVTASEREKIAERMESIGVRNLSAYLRKMALDGYIIHLDLTDVREMVSLLRKASNNLNQIARRLHQSGSIYETDIEGLQHRFDRLWDAAERIMRKLAKVP